MDVQDFIKLDYSKRFDYTIKTIKENKELWVLRGLDGKVSLNIGVNNKLELMIWCSEIHARYNLTGEWSNDKPEKMTIDSFLLDILPKLKQKDVKILLSTMENTRGKIINSEEFVRLISNE